MVKELSEGLVVADDAESAERRLALSKVLQERRERVLDNRVKNFESRKEQSLAQGEVLAELEAMRIEVADQLKAAKENSTQNEVERIASVDAVGASLSALESKVSEQIRAIPPYDQRQVQIRLVELREDYEKTHEELRPKKKFGFKKKKNVGAVKKEAKVSEAPAPATRVEQGLVIKDKKDETIELSREETTGEDVTLTNLENCVVKLRGAPAAVRLADLKACRVVCGPVATSVFVERATGGCVFALAAFQQLRAHEIVGADLHLGRVAAKTIIEYCSGLEITSLSIDYEGLEEDYQASGHTDSSKGESWRQVDDFNWLASEEHSPNWKEMEDGEKKERVFKM